MSLELWGINIKVIASRKWYVNGAGINDIQFGRYSLNCVFITSHSFIDSINLARLRYLDSGEAVLPSRLATTEQAEHLRPEQPMGRIGQRWTGHGEHGEHYRFLNFCRRFLKWSDQLLAVNVSGVVREECVMASVRKLYMVH